MNKRGIGNNVDDFNSFNTKPAPQMMSTDFGADVEMTDNLVEPNRAAPIIDPTSLGQKGEEGLAGIAGNSTTGKGIMPISPQVMKNLQG